MNTWESIERPNSTVNRKSGSQVTTAPLEWKPSNPWRWPYWKIQTSTPEAGATDSRVRVIALIGITIERNVTSSRRKAKPSTKANTIGARDFIVWLKSTL